MHEDTDKLFETEYTVSKCAESNNLYHSSQMSIIYCLHSPSARSLNLPTTSQSCPTTQSRTDSEMYFLVSTFLRGLYNYAVFILCTDDFNRVKLKPVKDIRGSDYINASYVYVRQFKMIIDCCSFSYT